MEVWKVDLRAVVTEDGGGAGRDWVSVIRVWGMDGRGREEEGVR